MSPAEIVATTEAVSRRFGPDIAHDVCCAFLQQQPTLHMPPEHWWKRVGHFIQTVQRSKAQIRQAYRRRVVWNTTRRTLTPEQTAECWELLDRIPPDLIRDLVALEGLRDLDGQVKDLANRNAERAQQLGLRRRALRYARMT